jgi:hypothetical protein
MLKLLFTTIEVIEMDALVAPAGTVMLDGINPPVGVLVVSVTTAPPVGDGPLNVAVSDVDCPPTTVDGLKVRLASTTALMVSAAVV